MDISDLPGDALKLIASELGTDTALELMRICGGMTIYIPVKLGKETTHKRLHEIKGVKTVPQIAKELGVSGQTVYNYLHTPLKPVFDSSEKRDFGIRSW